MSEFRICKEKCGKVRKKCGIGQVIAEFRTFPQKRNSAFVENMRIFAESWTLSFSDAEMCGILGL